MIIPKIIWQTHECDYEDLPEIHKYTSGIWKKNTEGWEYRYHSSKDRRSFIETEFPQYLYLYDHIVPGIYQSDFWRYLILYKYGGIYSDLDSVLEMDINSKECKKLINFDASINVASNLGTNIYNNCSIVAAPNNKVLFSVIELMIEKCKKLVNGVSDPKLIDGMWITATGPEMYNKVVIDNMSEVYISKMPIHHCNSLKSAKDRDRKGSDPNLYMCNHYLCGIIDV